ncbi:hypothetical protein ABID16_000045 [Rhizobium aquaticum]|uniref:Uncharacterized protein n=1 Tax=Rhizobium aquaticum TaxID=1549636 RepID=A0ABV2ITB9_9HYPH
MHPDHKGVHPHSRCHGNVLKLEHRVACRNIIIGSTTGANRRVSPLDHIDRGQSRLTLTLDGGSHFIRRDRADPVRLADLGQPLPITADDRVDRIELRAQLIKLAAIGLDIRPSIRNDRTAGHDTFSSRFPRDIEAINVRDKRIIGVLFPQPDFDCVGGRKRADLLGLRDFSNLRLITLLGCKQRIELRLKPVKLLPIGCNVGNAAVTIGGRRIKAREGGDEPIHARLRRSGRSSDRGQRSARIFAGARQRGRRRCITVHGRCVPVQRAGALNGLCS